MYEVGYVSYLGNIFQANHKLSCPPPPVGVAPSHSTSARREEEANSQREVEGGERKGLRCNVSYFLHVPRGDGGPTFGDRKGCWLDPLSNLVKSPHRAEVGRKERGSRGGKRPLAGSHPNAALDPPPPGGGGLDQSVNQHANTVEHTNHDQVQTIGSEIKKYY